MSTAIVWFRRDLRLADQPALVAAATTYERILPVYIDDGKGEGAASRWWLHHSLAALDAQLRRHYGGLHLRQGDSLTVLRQLIAASGAVAVYWNRQYEPAAIARDTRIKRVLNELGVAMHSGNGALWREPWQIATGQNQPYRVFTPYWRKLRAELDARGPLGPLGPPRPLRLARVTGGLPLQQLDLLPRRDWAGGLRAAWRPGEQGAREQLELFLDDALNDYAAARDLPARHGTSRLSPHLHFGEITPWQIHAAIRRRLDRLDARRRPDPEPYLRQLGWREFAHHLLYHFPKTPRESFQPRFAGFPWAPRSEAQLERWRQGRTGIPLVDAGMRELWSTGWMHNRVRMIVASFLTKNLRQHWRHGANWFWDTLVDADLANNSLGWQWVAGCGADAAPYFRVFNPITQARKFDPKAAYLKRWLPELAGEPGPLAHEPWRDAGLARRTGYPLPMVDLVESRSQALVAYRAMRD